jgi:hypothetical protein
MLVIRGGSFRGLPLEGGNFNIQETLIQGEFAATHYSKDDITGK